MQAGDKEWARKVSAPISFSWNFVPGTQRVAQNQKNMAKCREFDHSEEMSGSNLTGEKTTRHCHFLSLVKSLEISVVNSWHPLSLIGFCFLFLFFKCVVVSNVTLQVCSKRYLVTLALNLWTWIFLSSKLFISVTPTYTAADWCCCKENLKRTESFRQFNVVAFGGV